MVSPQVVGLLLLLVGRGEVFATEEGNLGPVGLVIYPENIDLYGTNLDRFFDRLIVLLSDYLDALGSDQYVIDAEKRIEDDSLQVSEEDMEDSSSGKPEDVTGEEEDVSLQQKTSVPLPVPESSKRDNDRMPDSPGGILDFARNREPSTVDLKLPSLSLGEEVDNTKPSATHLLSGTEDRKGQGAALGQKPEADPVMPSADPVIPEPVPPMPTADPVKPKAYLPKREAEALKREAEALMPEASLSAADPVKLEARTRDLGMEDEAVAPKLEADDREDLASHLRPGTRILKPPPETLKQELTETKMVLGIPKLEITLEAKPPAMGDNLPEQSAMFLAQKKKGLEREALLLGQKASLLGQEDKNLEQKTKDPLLASVTQRSTPAPLLSSSRSFGINFDGPFKQVRYGFNPQTGFTREEVALKPEPERHFLMKPLDTREADDGTDKKNHRMTQRESEFSRQRRRHHLLSPNGFRQRLGERLFRT